MVLAIDDATRAVLETTQGGLRYKVQSFYGSELTNDDVPLINSGSIRFDASGFIQSSGSVYLADTATDLVPKRKTDPLAPFGQELQISRVVVVGGVEKLISLGRQRIVEVPSMTDYRRRFPSRIGNLGWSLQLNLRDRLDIVQNDDFLTPTSATAGGSTWDELQRIAPQGIGIAKSSLPDVSLPAGITYTNLPDAITKLMGNIGGVPHMRRDGLLTARPKAKWLTATSPEFTVNGTVQVDDSMTITLYNCVVVTNPNNPDIVETASITDPADPLSIYGPLGRRVYKLSDPLMTTSAMAKQAAATALQRVSTQQNHTVSVTCLPRPDLELGDFGDVIDEDSGRTFRGEIASMEFPLDPTALMGLELIVAEVIEP